MEYKESGWYVAICNKINFDGHYVEVFFFPKAYSTTGCGASWYFLNRVNAVACIEAVYPLEMFDGLAERVVKAKAEAFANGE